MGTTTQHPPRSRLPQRIIRYPPNANRPRFKTRVKPTLSTMLTTIQKRQPLPKDGRCPRRHRLFEHRIIQHGLQVAHYLRPPVRACVFQRLDQPSQVNSTAVRIRFRYQLLPLVDDARIVATRSLFGLHNPGQYAPWHPDMCLTTPYA